MPLAFEVDEVDASEDRGMVCMLEAGIKANQLSVAGTEGGYDGGAMLYAHGEAQSALDAHKDVYASCAALGATTDALFAHAHLLVPRERREQARSLAREALAKYEHCVEAHVVLAMASDSYDECLAHYERALGSAEHCFEDLPSLLKKHAGDTWSCVPLRAYSRALHGAANVLRKMKRYKEALAYYLKLSAMETEWVDDFGYLQYRRHVPEVFLALGDYKGCLEYMMVTNKAHRDKVFVYTSTKFTWELCWLLASFLEAERKGKPPPDYRPQPMRLACGVGDYGGRDGRCQEQSP